MSKTCIWDDLSHINKYMKRKHLGGEMPQSCIHRVFLSSGRINEGCFIQLFCIYKCSKIVIWKWWKPFYLFFLNLSSLGGLSILRFCDGGLGKYWLPKGYVFRRKGLSDERKQLALSPCQEFLELTLRAASWVWKDVRYSSTQDLNVLLRTDQSIWKLCLHYWEGLAHKINLLNIKRRKTENLTREFQRLVHSTPWRVWRGTLKNYEFMDFASEILIRWCEQDVSILRQFIQMGRETVTLNLQVTGWLSL